MFLIFDLFYPEAVENWRKEKLEEVKLVSMGGISNSTVSREEAGMSMGNIFFCCSVANVELIV
jgi:hypothetical protein